MMRIDIIFLFWTLFIANNLCFRTVYTALDAVYCSQCTKIAADLLNLRLLGPFIKLIIIFSYKFYVKYLAFLFAVYPETWFQNF